MSLPEESVAVNTLPEVTTIPTGKKLIFTDPDTNEGGIITLENLTKQILQNLTTQTFGLDQGNLTLLQAINQLNSKKISNNRFSVIHIHYSDPDVDKIGGLDNCVIDAFDNIIPKDGAFYGTFTANIRYLMLGYRYITGKYGTIVLFDFNNNTRRWNMNDGKITKA
nr:hypothetical protein [uncultured Blautia sp.]